MSFVEFDFFGVYMAPIVPMMVAAFAFTVALRRVALALGLFRWIWHPALLGFATYLIVLTAIVVAASTLKLEL